MPSTVLPKIRPLQGVGFLQTLHRIVPLGRKYHPLLALNNPRNGLVSLPFSGRSVVHPAAWRKSTAALLLDGVNCVPEVQLLPQLLSSLKSGTLVDVGANIGIYTILFRQFSSFPIRAYEPQPLLFRLLELNVEHNNLNQVACRNLACGDTAGELPFSIGINGEVSTDPNPQFVRTSDVDLDAAIAQTHAGRDVVRVPVVRLDDDLVDERVTFLKIDCEGFEHRILLGAYRLLEDQRPTLFIEVHPLGLERFGSSVVALLSYLEPWYELSGWDFSRYRFLSSWKRSLMKHRPTKGHRFDSLEAFVRAAMTEPRPSQLYLIGKPRR